MKKNDSEASVINLGLSSLVEVDTPPARPLIDAPDVLSAFDWIDQQQQKGSMPAALIIERAISAIGSVDPERRSETLQNRIGTLAESLKSMGMSDELRQRLESAVSGTLQKTEQAPEPVTEKTWVFEEPISAPPFSEPAPQSERQPEWSRFAEMVQSVKQDRVASVEAPATPERNSLSERFGFRSRLTAAAFVLLCLGVLLFRHYFTQQVNSSEPIRFARARVAASLSLPSGEDLMIPRFDPLTQVGTLSSLAYEINTKAPLKAPDASPRALVSRQPLAPTDVQPVVAAPEPAPPVVQQKEALNIGRSNEPTTLRDYQSDQEKPEQENTFEFPPFIHKPKEPPANTGYHRDGGLFPEQLQHFNPPRRYSITTATQILSRPSYWAPRIGGYDPGDMISVDARLGNWLRVVGDFGEPAYILAQDAVPQ